MLSDFEAHHFFYKLCFIWLVVFSSFLRPCPLSSFSSSQHEVTLSFECIPSKVSDSVPSGVVLTEAFVQDPLVKEELLLAGEHAESARDPDGEKPTALSEQMDQVQARIIENGESV